MKKNLINKCLMTLVTLAACIGGTTICCAQVAAVDAAQETMTAEQVLARYVEVTGGIEKYKAIKGMLQEGTLNIVDAGIEGKMSIAYGGEGKLLVEVDLGGFGAEKHGINGETGWALSATTGNRLVTGKELEQNQLQADMRQYYEPSAVFAKMEHMGQEDIKGENCHVLKLTTKSGDVRQDYYSVESGLKVKSKQTAENPMGAMPIDVYYDKYEKIDGMMHAIKMTQILGGSMRFEIETTKIEINPTFSEDKFELPEEIKKLVQ